MIELQNLVNKYVLAEDGVVCIWLDPENIESRVVECKVGLRRIIFYIKALSHDIASISLEYKFGCFLNTLDILCPNTRR